MTKIKLFEYQKKACNFIRTKKRCGLFLDMGMGKTLISLCAIKKMIDDGVAKKILIIAPLRVANTTWSSEIDKWDNLKHLKYAICTGSVENRNKGLTSKSDIYIINRENVSWLVLNYKWDFDTVIIDESSSFKSHKSQRFKSMRSVRKYIENIILLTGTPNPQSYLDLWSQIYLIDEGERLGHYITDFRNKHFHQHPHILNNYYLKKDHDLTIENKISDICIFYMNHKDYFSLPDVINIERHVPMGSKTKKIYDKFKLKYVIDINDTTVTAEHAATLQNKLLQICNGCVYDNDGGVININNDKIEELQNIIEENPNENFLVAYNFKSDLKRLKKHFKDICEVLDASGNVQKRWNEGKIKMLLAHPASAGHGLNLQFGGNNIVWFGLTWSLELYQQFNKRLHRLGQNKPVKIIHLITDAKEERKVSQVLQSKAANQQKLLNALEI